MFWQTFSNLLQIYKSFNFDELVLAQPKLSEPKIESSINPAEQGPAHHERTEVIEPPIVKVTAYTLGEQ